MGAPSACPASSARVGGGVPPGMALYLVCADDGGEAYASDAPVEVVSGHCESCRVGDRDDWSITAPADAWTGRRITAPGQEPDGTRSQWVGSHGLELQRS